MGSSGVFSSLILLSPFIRTVKTALGAIAVHVVFSERKSAKRMKHIGSAHSESELALLRAEAQRIVDGDQLARECPFLCVRGLCLQVIRESVGVSHG